MNIKSKLLLPSLVGMSLIVSVIHFYWEPLHVVHAKNDFIAHVKQLLIASESDIVRHLLERDMGSLFSAMEYHEALHKDKWFNLTLFDEDGTRIYPLFLRRKNEDLANRNLIHVVHKLDMMGSRLGLIVVDVDWSTEKSHATEGLHGIGMLLIRMMLVILVIGVISEHYMVTLPLRRLRLASNRLAMGDFDSQLQPGGKDEIGDLNKAFLTMKKDLKASQKKLQEAVVVAESATHAKSEFLANMSHEIRTPMNGVLGMVEVLLTTQLSDRQRKYAKTINNSGKHLLNLLNDILDLSKIEANKLELELCPFIFHEAVNEIHGTFSTLAVKKKLTFNVSCSPEIHWLLIGDKVRLKQILGNLISNAIKFTSSGEVSLDVRLKNEDNHSARLEMIVSDGGIGISEQQMTGLFTAFQQADISTTRKYGGTGLGLSIVKSLLEQMGGQISVESQLKEGSRFIIDVTFEKGNRLNNENLNSSYAADAKCDDVVMPASLRILLAEDTKVNQIVIETMLAQIGYDVEITCNGMEAINAVKQNKYDLLFLDCHMPEIDGYIAAEQIRALEQQGILKGHLAIIALTANVMKGDRERCISAGMDDFLAKPINLHDLKQKIIKWAPANNKELTTHDNDT